MLVIWIVVEDNVLGSVTSEQCISVPCKPMLTESINNIEIRGILFRAELLMKVNVAEFTCLVVIWLASLALIWTELAASSGVPCSLNCKMLHFMNCTDVVHVSWSGPPTWHTGATVIGDNLSLPSKQRITSNSSTLSVYTVSYTHLTLPTIYSV